MWPHGCPGLLRVRRDYGWSPTMGGTEHARGITSTLLSAVAAGEKARVPATPLKRLAMIGDLLPPGVAWAERFADDVEAALFPAEEQVIARAVPKRRREFATGRWCARQALHRLGVAPVAILPGERGAPGWPPGITGSITHCDGYRAAVVAPVSAYASIGVDAEPDEPLPDGVLEAIALPEERHQPGRLLFSAKESVYKAWFPLTGRWLDFTEARVELREDGTFSAKLLVDGPVGGFGGRWLAGAGLLLTAVTVPASSAIGGHDR